MKVIVMMGDGKNTTTYFFDRSNPKYRGKHSDLFKVTHQDQIFDYGYYKYNADKTYDTMPIGAECGKKAFVCVYKASGPVLSLYFLRDPTPTDGKVYYNIADDTWLNDTEFNDLSSTLVGFIASEQLDWEEAWGLMSPNYYAQVTGDVGPWNDYLGSEYITGAVKDARMASVCENANSNGVLVYTIGFEIDKGGTAEQALKNCASAENFYYSAKGLNIKSAFSSVAGNLQQLRLTQ